MTKQTNTAAATLANVNVAFCENNNTTFNVDGVDYFATLGTITDTDTDGNDRIFTDAIGRSVRLPRAMVTVITEIVTLRADRADRDHDQRTA